MDQKIATKKMYCRLCLCRCTVSFDMNYGTPSVKQKIDVCFPDLDFLLVDRPRICLECFISLTHSYLLLIRYNYCQKTLNNYLETIDKEQKPISLNEVMESQTFTPQEFKHESTINRLKDQIEGVMMNMIEMELKNVDCDENTMDEAVNTLMLKKGLVGDPLEMDQDQEATEEIAITEDLPAIQCTEVSEIQNANFYNDVTVESVLEADEDVLGEDIEEFTAENEVKVKMEDLNIEYDLKGNEEEIDSPELMFACEECGMDFPNYPNLLKHSKSHKPECSICGKILRDKHSLKLHMNGHIKEKFACEKCGKCFKQKRSMIKHSLMCQPVQVKDELLADDE